MFGEVDKQVADMLVGKKIVKIEAMAGSLFIEFDDGSRLMTDERIVPGADGGAYNSTLYLLLEKGKKSGHPVLFQT